ncbi:MAG: hypothetical protein LBQ28_03395 [Prevotellaceae bacterium]|jgi:hypothetical protein|nr:hypothetical protein [Prevotellaceae bacterium]
MKKWLKIFIPLLICVNSNLCAQEIYGSWIKMKTSYANDNELPDSDITKYRYLKLTFEQKNKLFISTGSKYKGSELSFDTIYDIIQVSNSAGYIINRYKIDKLTAGELILVQKGLKGFDDKDCIKYKFVREEIYKNKMQIEPDDILLINNNDTIYKSTGKVHATFLGDTSFNEIFGSNISKIKSKKSNSFYATFIVRKTGNIDSIQILHSTNDIFEKQFKKALNRSKHLWQSAELNGKKVDVQEEFRYMSMSSPNLIKMYDSYRKAKEALNRLDYKNALKYFKIVLEITPNNYDAIYLKAICEIILENKDVGCSDLKRVKSSGNYQIDELIDRICR